MMASSSSAATGSSSLPSSSSSSSTCGDGIKDGDDICDGADLAGATCFEFGQGQPNGTSLGCAPDCRSYDVSNCGPLIASLSDLNIAVRDAQSNPGHETIRIPAGTYLGTVNIDVPCGGCDTEGVTLEPLDGNVVVRSPLLCVQIRGARNIVRHLELQDCRNGIDIAAGVGAGFNSVVGNHIVLAQGTTGEKLIHIASRENLIRGNLIQYVTGASTSDGILVENAPGNRLEQNVIMGPGDGIDVKTISAMTPVTVIDNNTLVVTSGMANIEAMIIESVNGLCARNNIFFRAVTPSTEAILRLNATRAATPAECGGPTSGRNTVAGGGPLCTGTSCTLLCSGGTGPFCDMQVVPAFAMTPTFEGCLMPGTALVDAANDTGRDFVDLDPALFNGLAPEIGARETGSTRRFGDVISTCP